MSAENNETYCTSLLLERTSIKSRSFFVPLTIKVENKVRDQFIYRDKQHSFTTAIRSENLLKRLFWNQSLDTQRSVRDWFYCTQMHQRVRQLVFWLLDAMNLVFQYTKMRWKTERFAVRCSIMHPIVRALSIFSIIFSVFSNQIVDLTQSPYAGAISFDCGC